MKKFLVILLMALTLPIYSQEEVPKPLSKIETLSDLTGSFFIKEFRDIVKLKNLTFQLYTLVDLIKQDTTKGIRLTTTVYNNITGTKEYATAIDPDEIDGLIKSIEYTASLIGTKPSNYTECVYKTRDGFTFAVYYDKKGGWLPSFQLNKYKVDSYIAFKEEDLRSLIAILKGCKNLL
jgi:hypothetical protein